MPGSAGVSRIGDFRKFEWVYSRYSYIGAIRVGNDNILLAKAQTSGNIDTTSGTNPNCVFDKNMTEDLGCLNPILVF